MLCTDSIWRSDTLFGSCFLHFTSSATDMAATSAAVASAMSHRLVVLQFDHQCTIEYYRHGSNINIQTINYNSTTSYAPHHFESQNQRANLSKLHQLQWIFLHGYRFHDKNNTESLPNHQWRHHKWCCKPHHVTSPEVFVGIRVHLRLRQMLLARAQKPKCNLAGFFHTHQAIRFW